MTEKTTKKVERHIEFVTDPSFRTINLNHVFGGIRSGYFEILVLTDEINPNEALKSAETALSIIRRVQCRLIIDPIESKRFLGWLTRKVSQYENRYGKIMLPDEIVTKSSAKKLKEKQPVEAEGSPKMKKEKSQAKL
jgi:hypothetical protein